MKHNKTIQMKMKKFIKQNLLKQVILIFLVFIVSSSSTLFGQSITSVTPNSAAQGTLGLLVHNIRVRITTGRPACR